MKRVLMATAVIEVGAGLALLLWPSETVGLLLGSSFAPPSEAIVRVVGAGPLALGGVNWLISRRERSRAARCVVGFMTLYNLAAAAALSAVGVWLSQAGILLWPAALLHGAMTVWCVKCILSANADASGGPNRS